MKAPVLLLALWMCLLPGNALTAQQPSNPCKAGVPAPHPKPEANFETLSGLAPVTVLMNTDVGCAALSANYTLTGGIQTGAIAQPTLLPFAEQQQQALRDAFITGHNLAQLADGLGSTLGAAYQAQIHYIDADHWSAMPASLEDVIRYATGITGWHAQQGKFFFGNGTTNGTTAVPETEAKILKDRNGITDIFGVAYKHPANTMGADAYGNSRPFQTEPSVTPILGPDYTNRRSSNLAYNYGPAMDLTRSPSYPSGHTTYGFTGAVLLAVLVPDRYAEMVTRGAEYGNDRILMASHYTMDVLAGRTLALYDMAHLLAGDPIAAEGVAPMSDFKSHVEKAHADLIQMLERGCGSKIDICAAEDIGRFNNSAANDAFYESTQTYNLPVVYPSLAASPEDVGTLAPKAGYLLTVAFPSLSLPEADKILTETEGPGGGFLDDGSEFGVFSRLNLYHAALRAKQLVSRR